MQYKEIHKAFSKKNWKKWIEYNLTYQEIQQWILIGFEPKDHNRVNQWKNNNFTFQEVKTWIDVGLDREDTEFALYLRWKRYQPNQVLNNLEKLKKEFNIWEKENKPVHEYLNIVYLKEKRNFTKKLNITFKNLIGSLNLKDFENLEMLDCCHNQLTSLNLDNCLKLKKINCSHNKLIELKTDNLSNLVQFLCSNNQLTKLDVNNCNHLKELICNDNYLESLKLPSRIEQLLYLNINNNNFPKQDLSTFSRFINLKQLHLGNWDKEKINRGIYNRFYGSLEPLKNSSKLEYLNISNTDINSGVEYLPDNWSFKNEKQQKLYYSFIERPESKVKEIMEQLTNFLEYGLCKQCEKVVNEHNWCQYCNMNTNQNIGDFIQKYERLKLIPYEQFTDIEYLAEGGFGKVYKAKWKEGNKKIVLKSLNNSQYIIKDFLQEIANHQTLFSCSGIVKCYGISQKSKSDNYLIVIDYIKDGDLKKFLQNNFLSFEDKFEILLQIIWGLSEIHNRNLIHCDFHSGNILNKKVPTWQNPNKCYIADLGLCRTTSETDKNEIYGVLPYIDPTVLRGESYIQASDVYSFGIIAYELFSSKVPYRDLAHDEFLAVKICQGLRPSLDEVLVPQLLKDLIAKCWDANLQARPKASELLKNMKTWYDEIKTKANTEFARQYEEIVKTSKEKSCQALSKAYEEYKGEAKEVKFEELKKVRKELFEEFRQRHSKKNRKNWKVKRDLKREFDKLLAKENNPVYRTHPQAIYTSRLLDFKNLPEPQNSKEINKNFYQIVDDLEELKISDTVKFSEELKRRFKVSSNSVYELETEEILPIEDNWQNINLNFTDNLVQSWQNHNFTYSQCKDWINTGLQPTDYNFAQWLRDELKFTPIEFLNDNSRMEDLKEQFSEYQTQIQIPPKS